MVAYDGGADHVIGYADVTPENVGALVDGAIYTRGPKEKQFTALFVGGGSMTAGEALFKAVRKRFFSTFRVSAMLDSNGSNTTAAAGVALLAKASSLKGKKAVVLAGTGPVGMRAAAMLNIEGAEVTITSRQISRAQEPRRLRVPSASAHATVIEAATAPAAEGAQIVFAAGAIGAPLDDEKDWQNDPTIELIADCNAQPPLGVGGVEATDKAKERHGKIVIGALGLGGLKLKLHRECVGKLFDAADKIFDCENIYAQAKELA